MTTPLEELEKLGIKLKKRKKINDHVTVKTFMPEEYIKIPPGRIHAFVRDIVTQQDKVILDTWMKHFELIKVPYRITEGTKPSIRARDRVKVQMMWTEQMA